VTICYLDPEDEITGAVARIRAVGDGEAIIVLPPGSRIATSRINFRLLGREAEQLGLTMVAVSDEPGVRALAISAGVPAYDSISAAQSGLTQFARQDQRLSERTSRPSADRPPAETDRPSKPPERAQPGRSEAPAEPAAGAVGTQPRSGSRPLRAAPERPPASERTRVLPTAMLGTETEPDPRRRRQEPEDQRRRPASRQAEGPQERYENEYDDRYSARRRRGSLVTPLVAVLLLLALVGVGAYGVYTFLPTATVRIQPAVTTVGPVSGTVIADPRVAVVDVGQAVIPAQQLELPLSASGEFAATGTRVTTVRATGSVQFISENTLTEVEIPARTRVATGNDVAFETTAAVTVPRAVFATGTPGRVDAPVRAVRAGLRGNVDAETITVVPPDLAQQLVFVSNPQPTSGGDRRTTQIVAEADYAAAVTQLSEQLELRLREAMADPDATPRGLTSFPSSARIGAVTAEPAQNELVGVAAESFSVTVTANARVLAVNEALIGQVMAAQLRGLVPANATLIEESVEVTHSSGEVSGGTIVFGASADGTAYRMPERDTLLSEIRGLPVSEARAIIDRYGSAQLTVWPDFIDRVPERPERINLIIVPPTETP
jgi:hypothetical protein